MSRAFHDLCFLPAIAVRKDLWRGLQRKEGGGKERLESSVGEEERDVGKEGGKLCVA